MATTQDCHLRGLGLQLWGSSPRGRMTAVSEVRQAAATGHYLNLY